MTPREALEALHRARRIASPWLPGMAADHHVRVVTATNDGFPRLVEVIDDEGRSEWVDRDEIGEPDTTDPATIGCLLALLREAEGDPLAHTRPPDGQGGPNWYVHLPGEGAWATDLGAPTEGEAVAAALVASAVLAAGQLPVPR